MLIKIIKFSLLFWIFCAIADSCTYKHAEKLTKEIFEIDSLLFEYKDSIPEEPQKILDILSSKRKQTKDSLCYYILLTNESRCYYFMNKIGDSFRLNKQVVRYCRNHLSFDRARSLLAETLNNQGVCLQEQGKCDSAITVLTSAVDLLQSTQLTDKVPSVYMNLADCYLQKGDFSWCGYYYRKALFVADSLGSSSRDHFAIYSGLAKLYLELENFTSADEYFIKAEQSDSLCTPYEKYFFSNTRGNYYYNTKEYTKALQWFRRADTITQSFPKPLYQAIVRGNMGEIFLLDGQLDSAHYYLDSARELFGDVYQQPSFRFYMDGLYASLALMENDLSKAEQLLSYVPEQPEIPPLYVYYNNRRLENLYYQKRDYQKAYEFKERADQFNDSLRNLKVKNNLTEMSFRYQQDTALLKKDIQLIHIKDEMSHWKAVAFYCALLLLLFVSISFCLILVRRRKREKQYWTQMATVNRLRMAVVRNRISPHFIFNALNIILPAFRQYEGLDKPIRLLIKVLRGNLFFSEQIAVSLKNEIHLVKEYLELRLLGDPERIHIVWEIPPVIPDSWLIPSMSVQIPVENAVKYAFNPEDTNPVIHISVFEKQNTLSIHIVDNGVGFNEEDQSLPKEKGTGSGLNILKQTIAILNTRNKDKIIFDIKDRKYLEPESHGTIVSIQVPLNYRFDL